MILYLFVFVLCTIYQNDPKGNSLNYSQFSSNILSQMKDYNKKKNKCVIWDHLGKISFKKKRTIKEIIKKKIPMVKATCF